MRKEGSCREKIYLFLIRIEDGESHHLPQIPNLAYVNVGLLAFESYSYYDAYRLLETVLHY